MVSYEFVTTSCDHCAQVHHWQVRLHDKLEGSSLAQAFQNVLGPPAYFCMNMCSQPCPVLEGCTHTHLYAKKLLHTEAFTQRSLSHRWALHRALPQTSSAPLQNRTLPQFLTFDPHFVRKACIWTCKTPILHFTPISAFGPHLVRKGDSTPRQTKFSISPHVCAPDTHHLRKRLRFVSKHLAAPAAKRENLEELEK